MKELNPKLNSSTAGMAFSASVVCYVFSSVLFSLIVVGAGLNRSSDVYKYLSYLCAPIAVGVGSAIIMRLKKQSVRDVAPVKCGIKYYIIALLMIFGLLFSVSKLNNLTVEFLKLFGYVPREESSYLPDISGGLILPVLIVVAVIPAVAEEFLFRGVILQNARTSVGDIRSIFITGVCFSLFHASAEQTVYQFICGCAFAFLAIRSGSIIPCVIIHFLNNAVIIVLTACGVTEFSATADIVLTVLGALSFVGAVVWLILDKKQYAKCQMGPVKTFFLFASVGIAVLAILWVTSFFPV